MVMFGGVEVEEVEVGPPLLVESNKLDCIVGSTMLGRVQCMFAAVALEVEEAVPGSLLLVENSKLDYTVESKMLDKVQDMLAAVWQKEAQGL